MIKAGIAYLVVAWLILQVLAILFPAFEASSGALKTTIIILAVGFPIWLIIAWIYDFSPEGIKKSDTVSFDSEVSKKENIRLNRVIIGGLSIAVILLAFNTFILKDRLDAATSKLYSEAISTNYESSIAILAFKDLSHDKDQEGFLDGLIESIYNRLVKYKTLKVISPTSSNTYKNKNIGIDSIGKELDVSFVLEGSVLKEADVFQININLVNTSDGSALWSKTFDGKVEDVLYTYHEISQKVAQYLKLTVEHKDVRLRKVDPEAYELYLKAETAIDYHTDSTTIAAEEYIKRSLNIDDTYAPAWGTKAHVIYWKSYWRTKLKIEGEEKEGIKAAKRAIELDPDLYNGYLWLSEYQWRKRDIVGYQENFNKVLELAPNNAEAISNAAIRALRTNKLEQARELLKKSRLLDPLNWQVNKYSGWIETYFGNYDEALSHFINQKENMIKEHVTDYSIAYVYYYMGRYEKALEELEKEYFEYYRFMLKSVILYDMGNIEESDRYLERLKNKDFSIEGWANYSDECVYYDIGTIYAYRGDKDNAFKYLNKGLKWIYDYPQIFFAHPHSKNLHDDPRWDKLLDKIGQEFNYDYNKKQ